MSKRSRFSKRHARRLVVVRNRALIVMTVVVVVALILYACSLSMQESNQQLEYAAYPRTYSDYVEKEAARFHVEPSLVYAVIKQESGFDPNCVSAAGAVGLMQIMPDTFSWLTESLDQSDKRTYTTEDLYDPAVNIHFGCKYLSVLLKMYPDPNTALAAYNAGMGNVSKWLKDSKYSADGKTLQSIPFPETQQYTKKVLANYRQYQALYNPGNGSSAAGK